MLMSTDQRAPQGLDPSSVGRLTHDAALQATAERAAERAVARVVATGRWGTEDKTHHEVEKLRLEIKSLKRASITTAASIVTAAAALIGVYLQSSVAEAKKQLAALEVAQARYAVDSLRREQDRFGREVATAQATLSNLKAERDAVAASLDSAQAQVGRLVVAVGNLPDDAQRRELVSGVERLRTSVENAAVVTDVQRAQEDTAGRAILATPSAATGTGGALSAITVDVFYLRDAPGQRERATRVREQLLATGALRDVRLKSAGPTYLRALGVTATEIRYDSDERAVAEALLKLLQGDQDAAGTTLRSIPSRTPSYLSLFLTPPATAGGRS
jgi:hypothetical protein